MTESKRCGEGGGGEGERETDARACRSWEELEGELRSRFDAQSI